MLLCAAAGGLTLALWLGRTMRAPGARPAAGTRLAVLTLLAAAYPLLSAAPSLLSPDALLIADASAHAKLAQTIARGETPHGWADVYNGGFPLGPHAQVLPVVLVAALIRFGLSPVTATQAVGLLATLAVPVAFAAATWRAGLRVEAGALGALVLTWLSPVRSFAGGWETYVEQGLLSQAAGLVCVLLAAAAVVSTRARPAAVWGGALAAAMHAQLTVYGFLVSLPAAVLAGPRPVRKHYVLAAGGAALAGLALYGPGLVSFAVPFSRCKVQMFELLGPDPHRFWQWCSEGLLLDRGRAPVFTAATIVASTALTRLALTSRSARAALLLLATSLVLAACGWPVAVMGRLGGDIVEFLAPSRIVVFVPVAAAAVVAVAGDELAARWRGRPWSLSAVFAGSAVLLGATMLPARISWLATRTRLERALRSDDRCGPATPEGYSTRAVHEWLRDAPPGRIVIDRDSFPDLCPVAHGAELATDRPLGSVDGGPGSQVGVLNEAFEDVRGKASGAGRAEMLGVRTLLRIGDGPPPEGWRVRAARGRVELDERISGTDFLGLGCVERVRRGQNRALRDSLWADLDAGAEWTQDPARLLALEDGPLPIRTEAVSADGCDAAHARIIERASERGIYAAIVESPDPVDVVVRATYVPTWQVRVDGREVATGEVAPGFPVVRVPPGSHMVEAVAHGPPWYGVGLLAALGALAFLAHAPLRPRRGSVRTGQVAPLGGLMPRMHPRALVMPAVTLLLGLVIGFLVGGLSQHGRPGPVPQRSTGSAPQAPAAARAAATLEFLRRDEPRYREAIAKAKRWLDTIELDPKRERELALGPYKKLVELLGPYERLYEIGYPQDAAAIRERVSAIAAASLAGKYLDLSTASDEEFRRDSMSYLRAGYLIERVGLDAAAYRTGVQALKARLDADFVHRGAWQQQAFAWYYAHYGLSPPPIPDAGRPKGLIAMRADVYALDQQGSYTLTHEVFVPYHYGELRDVQPFDAGDMAYLSWALPRLETRWIMDRNPDLSAELLSCMAYVGLVGEPELAKAVSYLLAAQNQDGSWGTPSSQSPGLGAIEKEVFYLHTTHAAVIALTDVFAPHGRGEAGVE